jgi:hypothetical protein
MSRMSQVVLTHSISTHSLCPPFGVYSKRELPQVYITATWVYCAHPYDQGWFDSVLNLGMN